MIKHHKKLIDIFTVDALYPKANFINQALDQGIDVVISIKEEHRLIMKEASSRFDHRPPAVKWKEKDNNGNPVKVKT